MIADAVDAGPDQRAERQVRARCRVGDAIFDVELMHAAILPEERTDADRRAAIDGYKAALADYLIPNETEAETLTGMPVKNLEDASACARRLVSDGFAKVIITLGANGALAADREGVEG